MDINSKTHIQVIISTLITLVAIGTVIFKFLEPFNWIQAFYFSVSTMTTVGYGDLVPSSDFTRLVVAFYALISVTLYVSLAAFIGLNYLEKRTNNKLLKWARKKGKL